MLPGFTKRRKIELDRMAAMLSRLGGRGYCAKEGSSVYGSAGIDFDPDSDFDLVTMNPKKKVHFIADRWGGQRKVT